jgi:prefoldin subunit 5
MKKGLLTVLAASLVFVGCQNYDDQFDDLNAQISALKSQVDGLSSLSAQVASLSGTISGLQAGIASAASSSEVSALSASLASLQSDLDAVTASIAGTASASEVTALQAQVTNIQADLTDLLDTSNIYSSDVSVTNATTLNSALALGNKINVLNADLTITGWAAMDYAEVQKLVDRINTMTGNITYCRRFYWN